MPRVLLLFEKIDRGEFLRTFESLTLLQDFVDNLFTSTTEPPFPAILLNIWLRSRQKTRHKPNKKVDKKVDKNLDKNLDKKVDKNLDKKLDKKRDKKADKKLDKKVDMVGKKVEGNHGTYWAP